MSDRCGHKVTSRLLIPLGVAVAAVVAMLVRNAVIYVQDVDVLIKSSICVARPGFGSRTLAWLHERGATPLQYFTADVSLRKAFDDFVHVEESRVATALSRTRFGVMVTKLSVNADTGVTEREFNSEWIPPIRRLTHVNTLVLSGKCINDGVVEMLASLSLQELILADTSLSKEGVARIGASHPALQLFGFMTDEQLDADWYGVLGQLPTTGLAIHGAIDDNVCKGVSQLHKLRGLRLMNCKLFCVEELSSVIRSLPAIEEVFIEGTLTLEEFLKLIEGTTELVVDKCGPIELQMGRVTFDAPSGFAASTNVVLSNGVRRIDQVQALDEVVCRSVFHDRKVEPTNRIKEIHICEEGETPGPFVRDFWPGNSIEPIQFQFDDHAGSSLTTMVIQPLYVEGRGWVEAHEVKVGDKLRGKDGPTPEITAIERVPLQPTYVIRTEGNLPYFVSPPGADFAVWVP